MMVTCFSMGSGLILRLLEDFHKPLAAGQLRLSGGVKIGTEAGKGSQFAILGQVETQGTGDLLHRLDLGSATDAGHGETDVDRRTDTGEEQTWLKVHLTVGD